MKVRPYNNRVLIIDDDQNILNMYEDILTTDKFPNNDFIVETTLNAQEGVDLVIKRDRSNNPFAMTFVDLRMHEGISGFDALKQIRAVDKNIYVVVVTGHDDYSIDELLDVIKTNFIFLRKPFSIDEIYQTARNSCQSWARDRELEELYHNQEMVILKRTASLKKEIDKRKISELKYRSFFEEDITGDYISTLDGSIMDCNPAFSKIFGFESKDEALNTSANDIYINIEDRDNMLEIIRSEGKIVNYQLNLKKKDGSPLYVIQNTIGIFDENQNLVQLKGYIIDNTEKIIVEREQKKLEKKLLQAMKMETIGVLSGGIAHDFNNILTPLFLHLDLALENIGKDHPVRPHLKMVMKGAVQAKNLIKQILTFSRQTDQEKRVIKIHKAVKKALKLVRSSLPSTIDIIEQLDNRSGQILADNTQFHQIIMNLCTNAFQAMESGGYLTIKLEPTYLSKTDLIDQPDLNPGEYVRLIIRDSGKGMDGAVLEKIFDPFFTTQEIGKGTGLGLSIVHGIVLAHSGIIQVESEVGIGTTFTLYFPKIG